VSTQLAYQQHPPTRAADPTCACQTYECRHLFMMQCPGDTAAAAPTAGGDDGSVPDRNHGSIIRIMRASGRERLELRRGGGLERILLTYRMLSSHGRQQVVISQAGSRVRAHLLSGNPFSCMTESQSLTTAMRRMSNLRSGSATPRTWSWKSACFCRSLTLPAVSNTQNRARSSCWRHHAYRSRQCCRCGTIAQMVMPTCPVQVCCHSLDVACFSHLMLSGAQYAALLLTFPSAIRHGQRVRAFLSLHMIDFMLVTGVDGEDEEAFMECLATEHAVAGATLPAVLKIRRRGASEPQWSDAVMLLSGVHAAGDQSVMVAQRMCISPLTPNPNPERVGAQQHRFRCRSQPLYAPGVSIHLCHMRTAAWHHMRSRWRQATWRWRSASRVPRPACASLPHSSREAR